LGDKDPRIDPLGAAAILTDTQLRVAFAPLDPKAKVVALQVPIRKAKIDQLQSLMALGTVHVQIKAGFGAERSIELTGPEIMILLDALDKFVTELPSTGAPATND
jgi:hypothetical protein